jgi:hypothetical protein
VTKTNHALSGARFNKNGKMEGAKPMLRRLSLIGLLPLLMLTTPASALTADEKMETCKFGADNQKLNGAKRKVFISRCMANEKSKKTAKMRTTKPNTAAAPASAPVQR